MRVIGIPNKLGWVLLLASWLAIPALCFPTVTPAQRQRAIEAFTEAQRLRTTLESQPESKRTKTDYQKVIDTYYEVYRLNPAYSKSPVALTARAELYEEMGRVFSSDTYYLESIKIYRFIIKEYPQNRLAREALLAVGEIYRTDLEDPAEARQAFQDFIGIYPKSDKLADAQEKLKQIDQKTAEQAKARATPPPPRKSLRPSGQPARRKSRRCAAG